MAESNKVKMDDGTELEFGTRKMLKSYSTEGGKVSARFAFSNGKVLSFDVPEALVLQAAGHGIVQKAGDSAAGEKDVEDMIEAVQDTLGHLSKGDWSVKREGGGFSGAGVVVKALCQAFSKTPEQIKAWVDGKLAEFEKSGQKVSRQALYNSFRGHAKVGPIIKELEQEKLSKSAGVDADSLLEGLAT